MSLKYFEGWFRAKGQGTGAMETEAARKAHEIQSIYVVAEYAGEIPKSFLEINLKVGYIAACFLDAQRRVFQTYQFQKVDAKRYFLCDAVHLEFEKGSDRTVLVTSYTFTPDGKMKIRKENRLTKVIETAENHIDVSENWEDEPQFGQYQRFLRAERGQ